MTSPAEPLVRLLLVEDDDEDFFIVQKMIGSLKGRHFEVDRASTYEEAMIKLGSASHSVCLLDYRLKGKNGLDFLREIVQLKHSLVVIFLTGQNEYEVDLEAMQLGAFDFLNKNKIDAPLLERSIRYALEHKRNKDEITHREEFFRGLLENALEGVLLLGKDGQIQYVSSSIERILGYSPEERMGKSFLEPVHPEDVMRVKEWFQKILDDPGKSQTAEFQIRHRNQSWRTLEATGKSHFTENSTLQGVVLNFRDVTERKKAEGTTARLATIVESSNDAIYLITPEGVILSWNQGAERIYGFKPEEIAGRDMGLIVPTDSWPDFEKLLDKVWKGNPVSNFVIQQKTKAGKPILVSLTISPIREVSGQFSRASVIARDITESEQARTKQQMLQDERDQLLEQLQLQMERMPVACLLGDQNFNYTYWNPAAEKMFGYSFKEVEGRHPNSLIVQSQSRSYVDSIFKRIAQGDMTAQGVYSENLRKDGSVIICEWYNTPLNDPDGNFNGVMSMAIDVTERQKAEEVQSHLGAILQQTTDAVFGSDLDNRIFSWNRGAETMFGYGFDEILGQPVTCLAPPDRKDEMIQIRQIALKGDAVSNYETVRLKKNGESIEIALTLSPIKDSRGKIIGVSAIARDITDRKKAEESLRKHEEQMRLAQKMDAIGRLAGGVAHDFNNLLSVIGGNAEFLLGNLEEDSSQKEELEEIQKAVRRGAELTKQLLVFGQKQVSQPQPVHLNELSTEMNKMLKRLIDAAIDFSVIQDPALKPILADPGQMQQVILNLVLNARDAMPQGGHLILETRNVESLELDPEKGFALPPGAYVQLSVTDTGIGMDPEVQKRIFEPFFTTKAGKGTGLGLATVYGIVNQWKGQIVVRSFPRTGSTFTLYFPALESVPQAESKPKQETLIPHGSETLLVAEDEDPVRKILVRTLERQGYQVLEARNGVEAVQKAWNHEGTIHLLLTDTVMPKMNGKELADELKKSRPKVKIIFISGYPREVLSQQGIMDPSIHLIQKPFDLDYLSQQIRKILDEK